MPVTTVILVFKLNSYFKLRSDVSDSYVAMPTATSAWVDLFGGGDSAGGLAMQSMNEWTSYALNNHNYVAISEKEQMMLCWANLWHE